MKKFIRKKNGKNLIYIFGIISILAIATTSAAIASVDISITPIKPSPKSSITLTVTFSDGENIDKVRIIVQECKGELCYTDSINESMSKKGEKTYEKQVTLKHSDATFLKYNVEYYENGNFIKTESEQIDLDISSSNGNSNGDDTPGFELFSLIIAISFIALIIRKKRL